MDIRGIYMMDIHGYPCIYHVYPLRWIYMVYPWISEYILWISFRTAYTWDIHGIFHGIYMVYPMYILEIGVPDVRTHWLQEVLGLSEVL